MVNMLTRWMLGVLLLGGVGLVVPTQVQAEPLVVQTKYNIISNHLQGTWSQDIQLSKHLYGDELYQNNPPFDGTMEFIRNDQAVKKIPAKPLDLIRKNAQPIYMSGSVKITQGGERGTWSFVLTVMRGNPALLMWKKSKKSGRVEMRAFGIALVNADSSQNDILFLGDSDARRSPFFAMKRVK